MKRAFLKRVITMGIATILITGFHLEYASAAWIQDENSNWSWNVGEEKATGWKLIDSKWYYFNEQGVMKTGWIALNGQWYHLAGSGAMDIGWINDNGTWYYTNPDGAMETGTISINGEVYSFDKSGALIEDKSNQSSTNTENTVENVSDNTTSNQVDRKGYVNTNSDTLNVRSISSTNGEIVGKLKKGNEVDIIGASENGFYPIKFNDGQAWVSSDWISFEKPENTDDTQNITEDNKEEIKAEQNNEANLSKGDSLPAGKVRTMEPSLDNSHYYSDSNIFYKAKLSPPFNKTSGGKINGNCTWYAWGRAWEYTGEKPTAAGFTGNAYEWWEANKKSGKYQYGSEPRVGAIGVWKASLPGSGNCGHVAFIEGIENGKIYISESMWHGAAFKYQEIYSTEYMYGYIYLDKPNY